MTGTALPTSTWVAEVCDLQLLDAAGAAVLITEPRLTAPGPRVLYCNPAFETMTGWPRAEIAGRTPRVLQGPATDHRIFEGMAETLARGETWRGETVNYRRDGTPFTMKWSISPVHDAQGRLRCYLAVQEDVSEMRRLYQEALDARARAEAASAAKSRFLATVGHELRTPLNQINGFAELIAEERLGANRMPEYRDYAREIRESGQHLLEILDSILATARAESGKLDLAEREIAPETLVRTAADMVGSQAEARGIAVRRRAQAGLVLIGDYRLLRQALVNLLSNAVKFAPPETTVRVTGARTAEGGYEIAVTDAGPGIPEAACANLRQPFVQGEAGLARRHEGLGLGLYLAHSFIVQHGGRLAIETPEDGGTRAALILPPERVEAV